MNEITPYTFEQMAKLANMETNLCFYEQDIIDSTPPNTEEERRRLNVLKVLESEFHYELEVQGITYEAYQAWWKEYDLNHPRKHRPLSEMLAEDSESIGF